MLRFREFYPFQCSINFDCQLISLKCIEFSKCLALLYKMLANIKAFNMLPGRVISATFVIITTHLNVSASIRVECSLIPRIYKIILLHYQLTLVKAIIERYSFQARKCVFTCRLCYSRFDSLIFFYVSHIMKNIVIHVNLFVRFLKLWNKLGINPQPSILFC